jgi:hypothetical protein
VIDYGREATEGPGPGIRLASFGAMTFFNLLPAALGLLLIAAHFLRYAEYPLVIAALVTIGLLFLRHRWSGRIVQIALIGSAVKWSWITYEHIQQRQAAGVPFMRMAVILFSVAAFSLIAAALLSTRRSRAWFTEPAEPAAAPLEETRFVS